MITYRAALADNARFGGTGVHMTFETRGGLKGAVDHATADECIAVAEAWMRTETGDDDVRPEAIIGCCKLHCHPYRSRSRNIPT